MQEQSTMAGETAGFPERFGAFLIDGIILFAVNFVVGLILPGQILEFLVSLAIGVGYVVYFWTSSGQTPGKMLVGLKVVNADTGQLIDPGTAVLRYVGYLASSIALGLGFLWIIWDPKKEGWHDKIAKTRVIKTK